MRSYRVRGPFGGEFVARVPGPGLTEHTFNLLVERGEWTVLPDPEPEKPAPKKRVRKTKKKEG